MLRRTLLPLMSLATAHAQSPDTSDWGYYGGDVFGQRYSSLAEIDRRQRRRSSRWRGSSAPASSARDSSASTGSPSRQRRCSPSACSICRRPPNIVIALEPATGKPMLALRPARSTGTALCRSQLARRRGVGEPGPEGLAVLARAGCSWARSTARLIALDACTGTPCADFGDIRARSMLLDGVHDARSRTTITIVSPAARHIGAMVDRRRSPQARCAATTLAAARCAGRPPRRPVRRCDDSGSRSQHGVRARRLEPARARCRDGKVIWQQELVHRDLWHFDLAAQPALIDLEPRGMPMPSVLQATKTGMLFVFDRESGKPVIPVVEQRVPAREGAGDARLADPALSHHTAAGHAAAGAGRRMRGASPSGTGPSAARCSENIATKAPYTPPEARGTILWPSRSRRHRTGAAFPSIARRQRLLSPRSNLPALGGLRGRHDARPLDLRRWVFPAPRRPGARW